jgi:hypothetical protein
MTCIQESVSKNEKFRINSPQGQRQNPEQLEGYESQALNFLAR